MVHEAVGCYCCQCFNLKPPSPCNNPSSSLPKEWNPPAWPCAGFQQVCPHSAAANTWVGAILMSERHNWDWVIPASFSVIFINSCKLQPWMQHSGVMHGMLMLGKSTVLAIFPSTAAFQLLQVKTYWAVLWHFFFPPKKAVSYVFYWQKPKASFPCFIFFLLRNDR